MFTDKEKELINQLINKEINYYEHQIAMIEHAILRRFEFATDLPEQLKDYEKELSVLKETQNKLWGNV
jgi:hypothetical protein